jgi:hypothetical protein
LHASGCFVFPISLTASIILTLLLLLLLLLFIIAL